MVRYAVPVLMLVSACLMATAWIGHLHYEDDWSFWLALLVSWVIVVPEYLLNTAATRWGYGVYSGAQMASMNLVFGVIAVVLVSVFWLEESLSLQHAVGLSLMSIAIFLILNPDRGEAVTSAEESSTTSPE